MASPNPAQSTTILFRRLTWQSAVTISIRLADGEPGAGNACDRYYVSYFIPNIGWRMSLGRCSPSKVVGCHEHRWRVGYNFIQVQRAPNYAAGAPPCISGLRSS